MKKSVTLIEIMISIAILSVGLVLILQGIIYCLNGLRISEDNLKASLMLGNKMAEARLEAKGEWDSFKQGLSERFKYQNLQCAWKLEVNPVKWKTKEEIPLVYNDLNEIRADFTWMEGKRKGSFSLATYMRKPIEAEE